tara:strand:- start:154 stop:963 length:810 start_codon:yes stop_codon:yes gene_type:complete
MSFFNRPKKSLGQNFLIDKNIINKISQIVNIEKSKTILEIGPGYGNLTKKIASFNPNRIFAVEKDKKLTSYLKEDFFNQKNVEIINDDILNIFNKNKILGKEVLVFGNLPYNISTKILTTLVLLKKWPPWYEILIFMFQKEVADRIIAKPNSRDFGRLSILCNWRMDIKKHFDVSKNCFLPKPKVNSTVLTFKPKKELKFILKNPKNLEIVTRELFSNRRKMINKNFLKLFKNDKSAAEELNLNLNLRPEQLGYEMFYKIAIRYENLFG